MKRATLALLAVVGIALSGCSATTNAEPAPVETVYVTQAPEPVETAEPAPVEVTPTPSETPSPEALMREAIEYGYDYIDATDEELMGAARYVCDQIAAGVSESDIVAVEGVTEMQNADFVSVSHARLCPES